MCLHEYEDCLSTRSKVYVVLLSCGEMNPNQIRGRATQSRAAGLDLHLRRRGTQCGCEILMDGRLINK
jgi:hypothetical protein